MSLNGKVAVVTGGGSGIGRAISMQLAKEGATVAVWDLNGPNAEETVALIEKANGRAIPCQADAASADGIANALARTHNELGRVTILVNNAAVTGIVPFLEITEELWDRTMRVNLKGPFLCTKAIVPDMLAARWGRIVNISSSAAQFGSPRMAHYVTSKAGIFGFTRSLALEYATHGITVNNIPPGYIDTPMLRTNVPNFEASAAASPMKRAGKPEDIATACAFLVSEAADYITGQTIGVNGGRYLT
jgi:2-hydroxycyclohexanecarboxyl-CoA dehydrogenase